MPEQYVINSEEKGVGVYKEVIQSDGSAKAVFTKVSIYAKQGNSYYISASGLTTEDYLIGASVEKSEDGTSETITTDPTNRRLILLIRVPTTDCPPTIALF